MRTFGEIQADKAIRTYIEMADKSLDALGYTEHSFAHVTRVAEEAAKILGAIGYDEKTQELTKIAGYLQI